MSMALIGEIAILFGAITFATAGLGLIRFLDVYTAVGLGIVFVVFGPLLIQPTVDDAIKAVILVILQLATAAIGSATIARAAYITGVKMRRKYFNELADGEDD